jgi:hypothetical protein
MASANPFHGIFETDTYIHARTINELRTRATHLGKTTC